MTKNDRERIKALIRTDLLTMNGGSGDQTIMLFGILFFLMLAGVFCISPLVGCLCCAVSGLIVCMEITKNEMKYHSSRMFCVLPISRRELVRSRFVFAGGITLAINIVIYLLMLLSLKIRIYDRLLDDTGEIIEMICEKTGGIISERGLLDLFFSVSLAAGMSATASSLGSYFKNSEKLAENMALGYAKNISTKEKIANAIVLLCTFAFIGIMLYGMFTGEVSFGAAIALVFSLVMQLAQAADGAMLCAVFLTMGAFGFAYRYICTVIDYEEKDI